jgi:tRNA (guanine-N7-)-methyltransferase
MGRRALRRIDPSLDLSRHLRTLEQLPQPFSAAVLFGRTAPLEIEVGSGKGLFLHTVSGALPEHDFLGCEISAKYARFAAAKLAHARRANAVAVHGDAVRLFREHLPDACAVAVHVYFPDPWWKKRHLRRRVMQEPLLRDIQRVLAPRGTLHFWTDVAEYFTTTVELIRQVTQLTGPITVAEAEAAHDLDYRTHFERRMRLHGEAVYRAQFRRK